MDSQILEHTENHNFLQHRFNSEKEYFSIFVLKVASRCNLMCTYCHWFRDETVYKQQPVMKQAVFDMVVEKLRAYFTGSAHKHMRIIFHGGEPMLLKKKVFRQMCQQLRALEHETEANISLGITTNGVLIDQEWLALFLEFDIGVSISVDANSTLHDLYRPTIKGIGSYAKTAEAIQLLQDGNFKKLSLLGVFSPNIEPDIYCQHYYQKLGVKSFDILIPNNNHDDKQNNLTYSIADFYIKLFDLWLNEYWQKGLRIRIIEAFVRATFNLPTKYPGIGICPVKVVGLTPNGDFEPYDVLRINGAEQVETNLNIRDHELNEVFENEKWLQPLKNSLTLPSSCNDCHFKHYCHGGNIIHRYSRVNGYENRSIYCQDYKKIYQHIISNHQRLVEKGIIRQKDLTNAN